MFWHRGSYLMLEVVRCVVRLTNDRNGLESLEWAIIAALIVVSALAAYPVVFAGLATFFTADATALNTLTVSL